MMRFLAVLLPFAILDSIRNVVSRGVKPRLIAIDQIKSVDPDPMNPERSRVSVLGARSGYWTVAMPFAKLVELLQPENAAVLQNIPAPTEEPGPAPTTVGSGAGR